MEKVKVQDTFQHACSYLVGKERGLGSNVTSPGSEIVNCFGVLRTAHGLLQVRCSEVRRTAPTTVEVAACRAYRSALRHLSRIVSRLSTAGKKKEASEHAVIGRGNSYF